MTKTHVTVSINDEIAKWFKDHGVNRSQWFEDQFTSYIEHEDPDFRAIRLAQKYRRLKDEARKIEDRFKELTGQTDIDEFLKHAQSKQLLDDERKLLELYEAMGDSHRKLVEGGGNDSALLNWIEARAPDFALALSSKEILSRLRNNGGGNG